MPARDNPRGRPGRAGAVTCAVPFIPGRIRAGHVEREIHRLGHRAAGVLRAVGAVCAILLVVAQPGTRALDLGLALALTAWGAGLLRSPAVVVVACLTQQWTVPPEVAHSSTSWVLAVASVAVAGYQWRDNGTAATAGVVIAYLIGGGPAAAVAVVWFVVEAVLSRRLYRMLLSGARTADRRTADVEHARRTAAVSAARRADAREHLAALHDTAAATLTAIGTGAVTGREPWLAEQFADDLATLTGDAAAPTGAVDLVRLLADVARRVPLDVTVSGADALLVPAEPAVAICRAAREALMNVVRHAGVAAASVRITRDEGRVVVEIADAGRGFDPDRVPLSSWGVALSIVARLNEGGGRARVLSTPGAGTRVRLEWPHE